MDDLVPVFEQYIIGSIKRFYSVMTPPPVSPLFQEGGPLVGYNEDLVFFSAVLAALFIIDAAVAKPFILPRARYFFLHTLVDIVVVAASLPDLLRAVQVHPYDAYSGPVYSVFGSAAVFALHFYHCIAFKVTADDLFHHILFVFGLATFGIPLKHDVGSALGISNFFLAGLPAGIEYLFLTLVIHGKMEKKTEKRWFKTINMYLRAPGAVWFLALGYLNWREGRLTCLPSWVAWPVGLLTFYNGAYYNQIAVESCTRFEYNLRHGQKPLKGDTALPIGSPTGLGALIGDDGLHAWPDQPSEGEKGGAAAAAAGSGGGDGEKKGKKAAAPPPKKPPQKKDSKK